MGYSRARNRHDWLKEHAPEGARIGYDPGCTAATGSRRRPKRSCRAAPAGAFGRNPIDAEWNRPAARKPSLSSIPKLAGQSGADKRQQIAEWLGKQNADAAVLAALDSIA